MTPLNCQQRSEAQRRAIDEWVKLGLSRERVEEIVQQVEREARAARQGRRVQIAREAKERSS